MVRTNGWRRPGGAAWAALPDGVPVLQLYRVMREQEQVVAVIESHLPGDMTTLVFPRVREGF